MKVKLNSGELEYHVKGEGRPLLHIHPAGGIRQTDVIKGLAKTHKVYMPVLPGYDGTPMHAGVDTMLGLSKLIGSFVEEVIRKPCDVIGHSFGGWVAAGLAAERPDLVDHLVLEGPAGFRHRGGVPADPEARKKALYAHPEKVKPDGKPPEVEAANAKVGPLYHKGKSYDEALVERLGTLGQMTLILQGSLETVVPDESVQLLKSRIRRSYLVYIYDAAHSIEVDQPERVLRVIDSFLSRSEAFVVNWG